jgi:hypothetical protein
MTRRISISLKKRKKRVKMYTKTAVTFVRRLAVYCAVTDARKLRTSLASD